MFSMATSDFYCGRIFASLVQTAAHPRTTENRGIFAVPADNNPKKEFQRKLNQSRTRSRRRAGDYPKILIVHRVLDVERCPTLLPP